MNATTHGIYAHPTAIPGGEFAENSDDVAEFTRQVVEDLRPTSEFERLLATRVAATLLHAARLDRYAALQIARSSRLGIIEQVAQASLGHGEFHAEIAAEKIVTTSLERIYQLDARVGRELERSLATYTRARKILVADQQ